MRTSTRGALCALAVAAAAACGRGSATAPAPRGAPYFIDANTALDESTLQVDFGRVRLGTALTREVLIGNRGGVTFSVVAIEPSEAFPDAFEFVTTPFSVDPGGQHPVALTFRPTASGEPSGSLRLTIEGGEPAELTVMVRGVASPWGDSPELGFAPPVVDFGRVGVGLHRTQKLVLANYGLDVPNTIGDNLSFVARDEDGKWVQRAPEIVGDDAALFSIDWPPVGYGPAGLAEGESVELGVHFSPAAEVSCSATLVVYTNEVARPRVEIPLTGTGGAERPCWVEVKPPALSFGTIPSNRYLTLSFAIINLDADPSHECRVSSLDLTRPTYQGGAFALVNGPVVDEVIAGGKSLVVPVRFQPKTDGAFTGAIAIEIENAPQPEEKVPLSGSAMGACLMIAPRELDFGTIWTTCSSRDRLFTMYNTCSNALEIDSIDLETGGSLEFEIVSLPALPNTLGGGESRAFAVRYTPVDFGEDVGAVAVRANGNPNPYIVPLAGTGVANPQQTDVFSQSDRPKVDILMVIDNSPTMLDKQTALAANLSSFVNFAVQQCVDYHIAVTTTDVSATGEAGRFLPLSGTNPRVITRSTPNAVQVFTQNAAVGTSGSETESLLRPAYLALGNSLINGHNAGFYRDEARLAVVIVSDAADQDPLQTSVVDYEFFFENIKGMKIRNYVTLSAIIPTMAQAPSGCSYDTATAGVDTRVLQVVQQFGGILGEICDPAWPGSLQRLASNRFPCTRSEFYLSNIPDLNRVDPFVVKVDGQIYGQYDSSGAQRWYYDAANNDVVFNPSYEPDPGTTLSISYYLGCL